MRSLEGTRYVVKKWQRKKRGINTVVDVDEVVEMGEELVVEMDVVVEEVVPKFVGKPRIGVIEVVGIAAENG